MALAWLLLASAAAMAARPGPAALPGADAAHEHTYEVVSRTNLPQHGVHTFHTRLRLVELERDDASGEQAVQMIVERNHVMDPHGAVNPIEGEHDMRTHAFYFRQAASGQVVGVMHHTDEDSRVLGSKRFLASAHQLHIGGRGAAREWETVEADAVGKASTSYAMRGGSGFLRPSPVVYKRQRYHRSLAVPEGFSYEANTTAVVGEGGRPASIRVSSHFAPTMPSMAQAAGAPAPGKRVAELQALDQLPQEPNEVTWTLLTRAPVPHSRRRRLSELGLSEAGFVAGTPRGRTSRPPLHPP